jgi:uncharacterized protein YheU (UPF0270 family)
MDDSEDLVVVPHTALAVDLLNALIESFVLREGTDYGEHEVSLADKVAGVHRQLERGDAEITFDSRTETVSIVSRKGASARKVEHRDGL